MALILFFGLAALCAGSVAAMIISRNHAHSALFLVLAFTSLGGIFGLLDAAFVAVVQILIYAGAIMVLFLFVIMMIKPGEGRVPEKKRWTLVLSAFLAVVLLAELGFALNAALSAPPASAAQSGGETVNLGRLLMTKYLYPFEITSILVVTALVSAIVTGRKRDTE